MHEVRKVFTSFGGNNFNIEHVDPSVVSQHENNNVLVDLDGNPLSNNKQSIKTNNHLYKPIIPSYSGLPLDLNPVIWIDFQDSDTVTGTNPITHVADKSGNGNDFNIAVGTPQYVSLAGHPCAFFSVGESLGRNGNGLPAASHPMSIYMLYRDSYSNSGRTAIISGRSPNDGNVAINDYFFGSWDSQSWVRFRWNGVTSRRTEIFGSGTRTTGNTYLWADRHDNSIGHYGLTIRQDNINNGSVSSAEISNRAYGWSIGGNGTYNVARSLYVYELFIFDRYLPDEDHDILVGWFRDRYSFMTE